MTARPDQFDRQPVASVRNVLERPVRSQSAGGAAGGGTALLVLGVLPAEGRAALERLPFDAAGRRHGGDWRRRDRRRLGPAPRTRDVGLADCEDEQRSEAEQDRAGEHQDRTPGARIERLLEQGSESGQPSTPSSVLGGWA